MHICSLVAKEFIKWFLCKVFEPKPQTDEEMSLKNEFAGLHFCRCVLLCNKGRISIEINKLRGHIIHSNLTRLLLSYFCISSLTNVSLMRPTEWTSHLLNFFKWNAAEKLFPSKTVHYWWRFWSWLIFIQSIINYRYITTVPQPNPSFLFAPQELL